MQNKWILRAAASVLGAVLVVALLTVFVFQIIGVDGVSMQNTLRDGERMLITKFDYRLREPERFEVVLCRYPDPEEGDLVKRIVGLPGDRVAIYGGTLYINGEPIEEPYIDYPANYQLAEQQVGEGRYFVLGDNRSNSRDSHLPEIGQLTRDQLLGRVRAVIWPLSQARAVD